MKLNIIQNNENIVVIPNIYKNMEKPPTFIFRSPNSQDMLNFLWGGNNVFEAVCNCFVGFENKIELELNGKPYEYSDYRGFVNAGFNGDIALIHNDCMNAIALRLSHLSIISVWNGSAWCKEPINRQFITCMMHSKIS